MARYPALWIWYRSPVDGLLTTFDSYGKRSAMVRPVLFSILCLTFLVAPLSAQTNQPWPAPDDSCAESPPRADLCFHRGDIDANGMLDITDPIVYLSFLFLGGGAPCEWPESTDVNGDTLSDIGDPILLLLHLFQGAPIVFPPFGYYGFPGGANCEGQAPIPVPFELTGVFGAAFPWDTVTGATTTNVTASRASPCATFRPGNSAVTLQFEGLAISDGNVNVTTDWSLSFSPDPVEGNLIGCNGIAGSQQVYTFRHTGTRVRLLGGPTLTGTILNTGFATRNYFQNGNGSISITDSPNDRQDESIFNFVIPTGNLIDRVFMDLEFEVGQTGVNKDLFANPTDAINAAFVLEVD